MNSTKYDYYFLLQLSMLSTSDEVITNRTPAIDNVYKLQTKIFLTATERH